MRLHLACGSIRLKDYLNIDLYSSKAADEYFDCAKPLPYPPESVDEIVHFHFFEHIPRNQVVAAVMSWSKCLKKGGRLIMETPDFDAVCKWYLETKDELALAWIYGNQEAPGQTHYWGWNRKTLRDLLEAAGFEVTFTEPKDYHKQEGPCLRAECIKE